MIIYDFSNYSDAVLNENVFLIIKSFVLNTFLTRPNVPRL